MKDFYVWFADYDGQYDERGIVAWTSNPDRVAGLIEATGKDPVHFVVRRVEMETFRIKYDHALRLERSVRNLDTFNQRKRAYHILDRAIFNKGKPHIYRSVKGAWKCLIVVKES